MSIERMKTMKEAFMCAVESQMHNLAEADAEELGEVVDMIKDLSEAIYYCEVTKAMEESEKNGNGSHQGQEMMYYTPMVYRGDWESMPMEYNGRMYYNGRGGQYAERSGNTDGRDMSRMYYDGNSNGGGRLGSSSSGSNSGNGNSYYTEREFPHAFDDPREGRSYRSRRMYMESKETHQDKTAQMKELEKYAQELTQDIVEMVEGASAEEKQYLSKKVAALANKITQLTPNG